MNLNSQMTDAILDFSKQSAHGNFYLYDTSAMRQKIKNLKQVLPTSVDTYYAMKANPHRYFLQTARNADIQGIEVASMGEGKKAIDAGFNPDQIIFTGPGKSEAELEWSVQNKIQKIHIESLVEAHRLNKICATHNHKQDILIRVNPNFDIHGAQAKFSGDSSKFGLDQDIFLDVLPQILELTNLNFLGLHVYAASGVLEVEDLLENCRRVFTIARDLETKYPDIRCDIIDFGGGFGVDYLETGQEFSIDFYAKELNKLIDNAGFSDRKFILELGRYLAADSGWYCTKILDIKSSLGKKQVICSGGAHHFRRPVALNINHPLSIISMNEPPIFNGQEFVKDEMAFVAGPLCNGAADKLAAKDIYIKEARIGDIAVLGLAGAYGLSMSHVNFLSHPYPEEFIGT